MNRLSIRKVEIHIEDGETIETRVFSNKRNAIAYAKKAVRNTGYVAEFYRWDSLDEIENGIDLQTLAYQEGNWEWESSL